MRSATHQLGTTVIYGVNHLTSFAAAREWAVIITATAGTLVIQHAQNSSTANNTTMGTNSKMNVKKIS